MKIHVLTQNESASNGFTHRAEASYKDLTSAAGAQTIALLTLPVGYKVSEVTTALKTAFAKAGDAVTFVSTSATIGDAASATQFMTATELNTNGTVIAYKAMTGSNKAYNAAGVLNLVVTPTAGSVLNELTAGEIHIFFRLVDLKAQSAATV